MARFTDETTVVPQPRPSGLPPEAGIPQPRPATLLPPKVPGKPGYGHNMTLAALMERQKQIADQQNQLQQGGGGGTIMGGVAMLANTFVNALADRRARKAEEEGNAELAAAYKTIDPNTGMPTPEAMDAIMRRAPDVGLDLYKTAMAMRASQGKQDVYGPVITGDAATKLGLDPTKSYQLNTTTGQYDPVGGSGTNITVGGGDKLTESLIKDTTFYPGALNANLELEDVDTELTNLGTRITDYLGINSNYWRSPEAQRAAVAGDAWIMNVLRRESGATIGAEELEDNRRTYLPQPGDNLETIEYKRRLREEKTATLRYGLEAAAPETLKKIDTAHASARAAREERRRKKREGNPDQPAEPANPDDTTPPPEDPAATPAVPTAPTDYYKTKRPPNITEEKWLQAWDALSDDQKRVFNK